jgi:hypothetical protein
MVSIQSHPLGGVPSLDDSDGWRRGCWSHGFCIGAERLSSRSPESLGLRRRPHEVPLQRCSPTNRTPNPQEAGGVPISRTPTRLRWRTRSCRIRHRLNPTCALRGLPSLHRRMSRWPGLPNAGPFPRSIFFSSFKNSCYRPLRVFALMRCPIGIRNAFKHCARSYPRTLLIHGRDAVATTGLTE